MVGAVGEEVAKVVQRGEHGCVLLQAEGGQGGGEDGTADCCRN